MRNKISLKNQLLLSIGLICFIALACYLASNLLGYRVIALILLLSVSILAMIFEIIPVLIAATLSALLWNFFFIPPTFTFHIDTPEDVLMFSMYFIVALVNGVLTIKFREQEKNNRDRIEKENSIQLYNTLLNSLSHELKTPIATIIGGVDTLKENNELLTTKNRDELLIELEHAGTRLNRQVENLLNMSRIENGMLKIKKDWTDINELLFGLIQQFSNYNSHQIIFIPQEDLPLIKIDRGLIENALQNILLNAIIYTPALSKIYLNVEIDSDEINIHVIDEGSGFPEELIEMAFNKFYRLPNSSTGGTGLGLSIVKGFVEAHEGKVKLKNREDQNGSIFTISIPTEFTYINNLKNE